MSKNIEVQENLRHSYKKKCVIEKALSQQTVTCSNSTLETLGKGVKYVQS